MSTAICVCGPYHGSRVQETGALEGVVMINGAAGPARYVLHHRISPSSALYAFEGSKESEVAAGVFDLAKHVV